MAQWSAGITCERTFARVGCVTPPALPDGSREPPTTASVPPDSVRA
jgi:hypothetical protein